MEKYMAQSLHIGFYGPFTNLPFLEAVPCILTIRYLNPCNKTQTSIMQTIVKQCLRGCRVIQFLRIPTLNDITPDTSILVSCSVHLWHQRQRAKRDKAGNTKYNHSASGLSFEHFKTLTRCHRIFGRILCSLAAFCGLDHVRWYHCCF